jgi:carbonic anhydrase/acetyltransferase-like protein (isoleucine patch superfamily)
MAVFRLGNRVPTIDPSAYVTDAAQVIGWVELGADSSVWFNSSLRGDNELIKVGAKTNIQEGCVLHTDPGFALTLGVSVTLGHQAMLHGCTVGDGTLVGIKAVILNGAKIGRGCLIGAGAIVTEGKEIPDRSLVLGTPGKVVRQLGDDEAARLLQIADSYVERARLFRDNLVAL